MPWFHRCLGHKLARITGTPIRNRLRTHSSHAAVPQCEALEQRQLLSVSAPISLGDISPGTMGLEVTSPVVEFNGEKYFATASVVNAPALSTPSERYQIWRTDSGTDSLVLVADFGGSSTVITQMAATSDGVYFNRSNSLWITDGTSVGTELVHSNSDPIEGMVALGDDLVLAIAPTTGSHWTPILDLEPYFYDSSADTLTLLKQINPVVGASVSELTTVGDRVYFRADDGTSGRELWRTDGTSSGTVRVNDLNPGSGFSNPTSLTAIGTDLYYIATNGVGGNYQWKTDTTNGQTSYIHAYAVQSPTIVSGDSIIYYQAGGSIVRSNGTLGGSFIVTGNVPSGAIEKAAAQGDTLYFMGVSAGVNTLFSTNGAPGGTQALATFPSATYPDATFGQLTTTSNGLVLSIDTSTAGEELYFYDSTAETITLLADIVPGAEGSNPQFLLESGGEFYFTADDLLHGNDVWRSDGTPGGTSLVDLNQTGRGSASEFLLQMGGDTYFTAETATLGNELWKIDGASGTPALVKDINPGVGGSGITSLAEFNGQLYFTADDGSNGSRLWRTDGTEAGTVMVDASSAAVTATGPVLALGNRIYFAGTTAAEGTELWASDGTAVGTQLVADIWVGPDSSNPGLRASLATRLVFEANDGISGEELWSSDGTTTEQLADIRPGATGSNLVFGSPDRYNVFDGLLLEARRGTSNSDEFWRTDGTVAGTFEVENGGPDLEQPGVALNGGLYFLSPGGNNLYFTDGSIAGTQHVATLGARKLYGAVGTELIYSRHFWNLGDSYIELWKYDTLASSSSLITTLASSPNGDSSSFGASFDGNLYFSILTTEDPLLPARPRLWQTDGTASGTMKVDDQLLSADVVVTGEHTSLVVFGDRLYFSAFEPTTGYELYYLEIQATANIGGPYSGDEGSSIPLSAAASAGATLYEWDLDNDGQYDDAVGENVNFSSADNGVFNIHLRINGPGGPTDSTTVTVNNVAPSAAISGTTAIYRGEEVTFTLTAADASSVDQAGLFTFEIDWDGNGTVDQTLAGVPSGTTVQHAFPSLTVNDIQVRATDKDGSTGGFAQTPITVTPHVLRDDGFGNTDLIWGGTAGLDAVFVLGQAPALSFFVQIEGSLPVARLDHFGSSVTGRVIIHGYGFSDVLIGDLANGNVVEIHGGDGDDVIVGGALGDFLYGDGGNDTIIGGTAATDGDDMLFGGEGRDTLFGHVGADTLDGGGGEDLLISDRFSFSDVPSAVQQIANEWKSARPYSERVSNILGTTSTGVNGSWILDPASTIIDDGEEDILLGGLGATDWFFYDFDQDILGDTIEVGEELTDSKPVGP